MSAPGKTFLEEMFRAGIAAVEPGRLVRGALRCGPEGISVAGGGLAAIAGPEEVRGVFLVGGGKAARTMGEAAIGILGGRTAGGALAVPHGAGGTAGPVRFLEAGHPLPDEGSREAARSMLAILSGAGARTLVVALISGGGSAMISAPPEGVSAADKEDVLRRMLRSGADIVEFNTVRKHLSRVKGGRMGRAAFPARVFALLLSDVPGDDPSVIASGPFSPDPTTYGDAAEILARRRILGEIPPAAAAHIDAGVAGKVPETPKPGDPVFAGVSCAVIGSNRLALEAASAAARRAGAVSIRVLPGFLRGEARECARAFVEEMRSASRSLSPGGTAALIAGGETTVTVRGGGKGGRNQEFALAAAIAMEGEEGMEILSAGTDGVDGPTDAAGAVADGSTCARGRAAGFSAAECLADNDANPFFRFLSDLVVTGPTGTNVADIAIGIVGNRQRMAPGFFGV
jgi:glycerate-2-kinase